MLIFVPETPVAAADDIDVADGVPEVIVKPVTDHTMVVAVEVPVEEAVAEVVDVEFASDEVDTSRTHVAFFAHV